MKISKDNHFFGSVTVGERGQIIIPKEARDIFQIKGGDKLFFLGNKKKGLALVKADSFSDLLLKVFNHHFKNPGQKDE